jgi:hypothetical protein
MKSSQSIKGLPPLNCDGAKTSNMIKSAKILERALEDSRKARRTRHHSVDAKALTTLSAKTSSMSLSSLKSADDKNSKLTARLQSSPLAKRHSSKADQKSKRDSSTTLASKSSSSSSSSLSKSSMRKSMSTSFLKKDDLNPRGMIVTLARPFHIDSQMALFIERSLEDARVSAQLREEVRKQAWSEFLVKRSEILLLNSLMKHLLYDTKTPDKSPAGV